MDRRELSWEGFRKVIVAPPQQAAAPAFWSSEGKQEHARNEAGVGYFKKKSPYRSPGEGEGIGKSGLDRCGYLSNESGYWKFRGLKKNARRKKGMLEMIKKGRNTLQQGLREKFRRVLEFKGSSNGPGRPCRAGPRDPKLKKGKIVRGNRLAQTSVEPNR